MAGVKLAPDKVVIAAKVQSSPSARNTPKYQLGQQIAEPAIFVPTVQWASKGYIYRVDARRKVCKRVSVNWRSSAPVYFTIAPLGSSMLGVQITRRRAPWHRPLLSLASTSALAAICLLIYPYYPEVTYNVKQSLPHRIETQAVEAPITTTNQLSIPKIGVTAAVLDAPSLDILDREQGVWHQIGAVDSNFVVAGHRFKYLPPNTTTFYNLGKLEAGDTAVVDYGGKRRVYVVREARTVKASEISILNPTTTAQLTLYTCSDKKEIERIVVFADLLP